MVESARGSKRIVAIDGCTVACAKKAIEHAGLKVTDWVFVTDEGVSKNHEFMMDLEQIDLIKNKIKESLSKPLTNANPVNEKTS